MAWREASVQSEREEFVRLCLMAGSNRRALCRRFGISAPVGYKWLRRFEAGEDLSDRSRRPATSPSRSAQAIEASVLAIRQANPAWGARKIARILQDEGRAVPALSTVHAILARHGCIVPPAGGDRATLRFAMERPNALWQMDFKGWVRTGDTRPMHPLTAIDDHSRYALGLQACPDQSASTVRAQLERIFTLYGLPDAIFVDNGPPWGSSGAGRWTSLRVWLLKLGVDLIYARPYHPQSRGKNERFHRTLDTELLSLRPLRDLAHAQAAFEAWRHRYNHERPHEALGQDRPASHYTPSSRTMPGRVPDPEYDADTPVRRVSSTKGYIRFKGQAWRVPDAFRGERLAIRPTATDGRYAICFGARPIASIDLTQPAPVSDLSEHPSTMSPG